jgi:hypothetical protein
MKIVKTKVYQFKELSETAKKKALEKLYDINVDYDWWDSVYDDAEQIGLKITSFDIYHKDITGELTLDIQESCKAIMENHGEKCETYKTAKTYLEQFNKISDENREDENEDLTAEYEHDLLEDYLVMLSNEYDYMTSEQAIVETIEANEYDFTEDGRIFRG